MRVLVIGLGSMGKRRIRCLRALGITEIAGFDIRADRRDETQTKYGISCYSDYSEAISKFDPIAMIISVPPDKHHIYIDSAIRNKKHFFVEASVVDTGISGFIQAIKDVKIVAAPSATLYFHPAIKLIKTIIDSGELGKLSNILLHSGQFLPDWHTYESVADYYVSTPATGGAREIVPFELSWFTKIFGWPRLVAGNYRKTINIDGADYIDDTYNLLLDYSNYLAVITVDVVSRYATRRLTINGSKKQLIWSWDENLIRLYDPTIGEWEKRYYEIKEAEIGYNANIGEDMYVDELKNFFDAIDGSRPFFNTMEDDLRVLNLLYKSERSDMTGTFLEV